MGRLGNGELHMDTQIGALKVDLLGVPEIQNNLPHVRF